MIMNTARRYGVDLENAEQVRRLALMLFDQTRRIHALSKDYREWIAAAAMLYEVGMYINPVGLHRHAYYVISRSELFGFTPFRERSSLRWPASRGIPNRNSRSSDQVAARPDQVRRYQMHGASPRGAGAESGQAFCG